MNRYQKTSLGLAALTVSGLLSYKHFMVPRMVLFGVEEGMAGARRAEVEEMLEDHLPKVIDDLEKEHRIDIKGIPSLEYEVSFWDRDSVTGSYNPLTQTISINSRWVFVRDRFLNMTCYDSCFFLHDTLRHELGHYYTHQLIREEGYYGWDPVSRVSSILVDSLDEALSPREWRALLAILSEDLIR